VKFVSLNFFCHTLEGSNFQLLLPQEKKFLEDMALLSEIRHTDRGVTQPKSLMIVQNFYIMYRAKFVFRWLHFIGYE